MIFMKLLPIAVSILWLSHNAAADSLSDFKAILMFFSEPYLKGAEINGMPLEGATSAVMGSKLVEAIGLLEQGNDHIETIDRELYKFKEQLAAGIDINQSICTAVTNNPRLYRFEEDTEVLERSAVEIQENMIEAITKNEGLVLPFGWIGHALALVVKPGVVGGTFDLAFVNTGEGIKSHYHEADPNGIYPALSQVWVEFSNVPSAELFTDRAWFVQVLIVLPRQLYEERFRKTIAANGPVMPIYFYGSFLANFTKYLVEPRKDRLVPKQQSGSCTLSSLMGALLYISESEATFQHYKLKIGHALIESFLDKIDNDIKFKEIIADGFGSGRKFFKGLSSAIAQQALKYLECTFPDEFKHAGLLGNQRYKWIFERKEAAINALSAVEKIKIFINIQKCDELSRRILIFLKKCPIPENSNKIVISEDVRKTLTQSTFTNNFPVIEYPNLRGKPLFSDFYKFLAGSSNRTDEPIGTFAELYAALKELSTPRKEDMKYLYRVFSVFKRARSVGGKDWWHIVEEGRREELLQLQNFTRSIIFTYIEIFEVRLSFDDLVLLIHLQKLAWKLALAYDKKLPESSRIGLEYLNEPKTLQSVLFGMGSKHKLLTGSHSEWYIRNSLDPKSLEMFMEVLDEDGNVDGEQRPRFVGPEGFSEPETVKFKPEMPDSNSELYFKMMDCDSVTKILQNDRKWRDYPPSEAKFLIVFYAGMNELSNVFPQYYNLMTTLALLRLAAVQQNSSRRNSYWLKDCDDNNLVQCHYYSYKLNFNRVDRLFNYFLTSNSDRSDNLFFIARHSAAIPPEVDLATFESWLNYMKASETGKLFDYTYFQYLSDHILNIPEFDNNGKKIFPVNELAADSAISELTRLIGLSLNELNIENFDLNNEKRVKMVNRAVNISVILTRFISRIEYENVLNGKECAIALANLYNIIQPFSKLISTHGLNEPEIGKLNFALAHICSIPLRNNLTFMKNAEVGTDIKGLKVTLERFYWFIAKRHYKITKLGGNVADDQFNYGNSYNPLKENETEFLQEILSTHFLPSLLLDPSELTDFRYHSNGFIIEIHNPKDPSINVMLNLCTGALVQNGMYSMSKMAFLNSNRFLNFFKNENLASVSNGRALEAAGMHIYSLPNIKGSSYFVVLDPSPDMWQIEMTFFKKFNGFWYQYLNIGLGSLAELISISHVWIMKNSSVFIRKIDAKSAEYLVFPETQNVPILSFIVDKNTNGSIIIDVDGFNSKNSDWTVINRNIIDMIKCTTLKNVVNIQRHLHSFSNGDYILARDGNEKLVIIYLGLRLPEDPNRPLVLLEKAKADIDSPSAFQILNVPDMEVCSDQTLAGGASLPGGLLVISDSKKVLLIPNIKRESNTVDLNYSFIEKIPVLHESGDELAPQSRLQKLLLAYNMTYTYNFDSARNLLHPSKSISQNEPFSVHEMDILKWFLDIDSKAPEAVALKLFAFIHSKINNSLFPSNNEVELNLFHEIPFDYLYFIRELSEKYYIFRLFPEVLEQSLFAEIFGNVPGMLAPARESPDSYSSKLRLHPHISFWKFKDEYEIGTSEVYWSFLNLLSDGKGEIIKHLSHFLIRRKKDVVKGIVDELKGPIITLENHDTMDWICYAQEPNLWAKFAVVLSDYRFVYENTPVDKRRTDYFFYKTRSVEAMYSNVIKQCSEKYSDQFKGINQSLNMETTSLRSIKETMDSYSRIFNFEVESASISSVALVKDQDVDRLKNIENYLRSLINNLTISTDIELDQTSSALLNDLSVFIESQINDISTILTDSATELILMTNINKHASFVGSILSLMHQRKIKTFESLYACYLKDSLSCIQLKFPQLTLDQCRQVEQDAKIFYSRKILVGYFEVLKDSIENFLKFEFISMDDLSIFCDELSKISDFNKRMEDPVIMNFEFRSGKYRLKPEQADDVSLLSSENLGTQNFKSVVIQRMMAAGKTLVLGTISVVKKALKGGRLSILVPPASLYLSNTTAMQARTYSYFKKKGKTFSFSRFHDFDKLEKYMKVVLKLIKGEIKAKDYLILSPDTLHSYLNSYIENLLKFDPNEIYTNNSKANILKKFAEIYLIFKERGSIILDEIDMTMDPKKELNFPTQETEPYNMTAVVLLADIMEFMIFDKAIIASGLKIHSNNQASLTHDNYKKCLGIIFCYIEKQLNDESSLWYKFVLEGSRKYSNPRSIIEFLRSDNMSKEREWITNFHNLGNEIVANALIIVKSQIHHHMEHSLKGTVNQNFGSAGKLRPEIKFAIPYVSANTPSTSSIFADRWETLLKTLLMIAASPCSRDIAKELIRYVRDAIPGESAGLRPMEKTTTYVNMKLILPNGLNALELDHQNSAHVKAVQRSLAPRSPAAIRTLFSFYITHIFDKMTFPTEQITSNALNVASMFGSVQGYSGTIDNVNILPQNVVKDAKIDHDINEKNNHAISKKLIDDASDEFVPEMSESTFSKEVEEMVEDMMNFFPSAIIDSVSAIIDTGAFFKNFKNRHVTEAFLLVLKGKFEVGLYYCENSNKLEFTRLNRDGTFAYGYLDTTDPEDIKRVTQANLDKRFTFYDQRHITGSDILQPKTAQALMTCGPRVLLRDILQGALRMRQLMTSQKVHFVTTAASREFYCSKSKKEITKVRVSDILRLGSLNEEDKQEQENQKLAFVKIDSEIRAFILEEISRILFNNSQSEVTSMTANVIMDMVKTAKPLLLRSIKENPLNWLKESKEEATEDVLKTFAESRLFPLKSFLKTLESSDEILDRFKTLEMRIFLMITPDRKTESDSLLFYAKPTIHTTLSLEAGSEVQQQILSLNLVDVDMCQLNDTNYDSSYKIEYTYTYSLLDELFKHEVDKSLQDSGKSDQYVSLGQVFSEVINKIPYHEKYVKDILLSGGSRIGVTEDLVRLVQLSRFEYFLYPIFSKFTLEGSHFLIQLANNNFKVLLISTKHASKVLKDIGKHKYSSSQFWLCDLSGAVSATNNSDGIGHNVLDFIPQIREMIFDLLIFNGSLPHILCNPILKSLYYNKWLQAENFQHRAIFLRLRMKFLIEKDQEIFEKNNSDLGKLKKYSMGDKNPSLHDNFFHVYPKEPVDSDFESEFTRSEIRFGVKGSTHASSVNKELRFDLVAEIRAVLCLAPGNTGTIYDTPIFGLQSSPVREDIDIDPREIPVKSDSNRLFIHIPNFHDNETEPEESSFEEFKESVETNDDHIKSSAMI
jgi:hypothetical protein